MIYGQKKPEQMERRRTGVLSFADLDHIDKSAEAALYYGFIPIKTPHITPSDITKAKQISQGEIIVDSDTHESGAWTKLEEKVAILRTYEEYSMHTLSQPLMLSYTKPFIGDRRKSLKESHIGLEIVGTDKSIAEALLIKTALAILSDQGIENLHIDINSIGDKESLARFTKEITNYYRKHINDLSASCRQMMKKDIFSLLGCQEDKCKELAMEAPKSINFLSERSREHFKEILEYLEDLDISYTINNSLVANRDYCSETIFEIRGEDKQSHPLAVGLRYNSLAKRLGNKKDLPAVGVSIAFKKPTKMTLLKRRAVEKIMNPKISFMQLGSEAKRKSLVVIEELRKAKVAVVHSLTKDKMAGQVIFSEKMKCDYFLIMGKKESMEESVIVRDGITRAQDTVLIKDIASRIKKVK